MPTVTTTYASILILEAVISLFFAIMTWRRRREPGAAMFIVLTITLTIWSFSYGMEQLLSDLASKSLWHHMAYLAIPLVAPAWLAFSIQIQRTKRHWLHRFIPFLFATGITVVLLAWTDRWHTFLWNDLSLVTTNGLLYLNVEKTTGFFIYAALSYIFILVGTVLFLNLLIKSHTLHIVQIIALGGSILAPLFINVLYVLQKNPFEPLDLTPLALTTATIAAGWFVFRFQLSDLLPLIWQTVFESMRDGVIVLNTDYRIVNVNPAGQYLLGYASANILNRPIDELIPHASEQIKQQIRSSANVTPKTTPWEFIPTGRIKRNLDLTISDLTDRRNRHTGWMLVMRDVTRRRLAEDALRESERQYRTLIEFSPDAIVVTDIDLYITLCNNRTLEICGVQTLDEMNGRSVLDFLIPEDRQRLSESVPAAIEIGQGGSSIYTIQHLDGTKRPVEINSTLLLDSTGSPKGFLSIVRDIAERLRSEEILRQSQRMEGIGLLAGGVAHDFNNMLTSIIAQNSLALARIDDKNFVRTHVDKAIQSAERAADLTRQLLAYAGKGNTLVAPLDLNRLIRENDALLETAVPRKIKLSISLTSELASISADQGQMQQVLMNLVLNAVEAIEDAVGAITIQTDMHFLSEDELEKYLGSADLHAGEYVRLRVEDSGIGMTAKTLDRIFDPFFTTKPTGRGLGLSALLGIIRSHHGALRVESHEDEGTIFHVVFPPIEQEVHQPRESTSAPVANDTALAGTVLLIEDEAPIRESLSEILQLAGLKVLTANDGEQGVAAYLEHQSEIDLILLDLSMPVMDGHEALERIREVDSELCIILLSGYSATEISDTIFTNQHTNFVQKPFSPRKLLATISDILTFA